MSEFEEPKSDKVDYLTYEPGDYEHRLLYVMDHINTPGIPGTWDQDYVGQIGNFILQNSREIDARTANALNSVLLGSGDFTSEKNSTRILEEFHLAEASVRGLHPWEFNTILQTQYQLDRAGIQAGSIVDQREILLEGLSLSEEMEIKQRGKRISGLQLAAVPYVILSDIDADAADKLLDEVIHRYGSDYFDAKALFQAGTQVRDSEQQNAAAERSLKIANEASRFIHDHLRENLSKEQFGNYLLTRNRLEVIRVIRDLKENIEDKKLTVGYKLSVLKDSMAALLKRVIDKDLD
jgi:hypothetical protein